MKIEYNNNGVTIENSKNGNFHNVFLTLLTVFFIYELLAVLIYGEYQNNKILGYSLGSIICIIIFISVNYKTVFTFNNKQKIVLIETSFFNVRKKQLSFEYNQIDSIYRSSDEDNNKISIDMNIGKNKLYLHGKTYFILAKCPKGSPKELELNETLNFLNQSTLS